MDESTVIATAAAAAGSRDDVLVGIGDDAAVLAGAPPLVAAHDVLVEGVHFRWSTHSPADVGHAALAANLSDLAAMGAEPWAALVGLVAAPGALDGGRLRDLYAGMGALADATGCAIVGGDTSAGPVTMVGVTVLGRMPAGVEPVTRAGGRPGDVVCVTGTIGASAAGRAVLAAGVRSDGVSAALAARHRRPVPRLAAGRALAALGAHAMMDVSDGLVIDLGRLAAAGGLHASLTLEDVPLAPGVAEVAAAAGAAYPALWAATGGEDFELLVALPPELVATARGALDVPLTPVGRFEAGPRGVTVTRRGRPVPVASGGWEHHV